MIEDCLSIIESFIDEVAFKIILKKYTSIIHILLIGSIKSFVFHNKDLRVLNPWNTKCIVDRFIYSLTDFKVF